ARGPGKRDHCCRFGIHLENLGGNVFGAKGAPSQSMSATSFYARSYAVSVLVIRVGGSLQTIVKMFTDVLRTFSRNPFHLNLRRRNCVLSGPKHRHPAFFTLTSALEGFAG